MVALALSLNLPWPSKFAKSWSFYDLTSWSLSEVLTVLTWRPLSKQFLVFFFLVTRSILSCCLWGFVVPLFCTLMPNMKILSFWSEIFKLLLGETHVFGSFFYFCTFCLKWWGFEFAPACGSPASVSDHGATNKDFSKVERLHTRFCEFEFFDSFKSKNVFFFSVLFIILVL